ncbi:MAG: sigma-70 family RNA polymerase sigma factor, partial [Actinobacteria bacterium]|nr:sigma-70 family RNA polymerase sigma factor [Actinomycetota bacterium]
MNDSEVATAIAAGDPAGLAAAYDRYAAALYGYCRWMLPGPGQAADALLDTFVAAAATLGELRDAGQTRAWLYANARDACLSRKPAPEASFEEMAGGTARPADAKRAELRRLIRATLAEFGPLEQEVIELTIRHNLDETELAVVLAVSWSRAHALASRAREQLEKALTALLIARTGRQSCPELGALLAGWDGRLTVETGKLTARHVERCETCTRRRPGALRPEALAGLLPLAALPGGLREPILRQAAVGANAVAGPDAQGGPETEPYPGLAIRPQAGSYLDPAPFPEAVSDPGAEPEPEPDPRPQPEPDPASRRARRLAGVRQAGTLLRWSRIRANPGPATAAAAVTMWVIAAVSVTLITITGTHATHALAAQTRPAAPSASAAAGRGTPASAEPSRSRSHGSARDRKPAALAP